MRPQLPYAEAAAPRALKRTPAARNAATVDACKALANCAGRAVTTFALAAIAARQADATARDEEPRLDNDGPRAPDKPWQTFDNLVAAEPDPAVKTPITVATDVKTALAALLLSVADLVNAVGKLPAADPLGALARAPWREAALVRAMVAVTEQMRPALLNQHPLSRDLEFPLVFRQKFEALVMSKALVDPGAEAVARLYVDFLKAVAWHVGVWAYEGEHFTLNCTAFLAIVASMAAVVPAAAAGAAWDTLGFVRNQIEIREAAVARVKATKKKPAPAAAAAAAKPAAPAAGAAAKPAAPAADDRVPQPVTPGLLAGQLIKALADADAAPKPAAAVPAAAVVPGAAPKPAAAPAPAGNEVALEMNYEELLGDLQQTAQ